MILNNPLYSPSRIRQFVEIVSVCPGSSWPRSYSKLLYKMGHYFLDIPVCPRSSDPFCVLSHYNKKGHYFLDILYIKWVATKLDIQNVSKIGINYIFRQRKYLGTSIRIQHADLMSERCRQLRLAFCQHLGIHRSQNCWKVTELALILKKMFQSIINIQVWQNGGTKDWLNRLSGVSYIAIGWSSQQGCHWSKQKRQFVGASYWFKPQEAFLYIRKTSRYL